MSHADHDWVREVVPRIRALAEEVRRSVGILLDTEGPAIRTGDLEADLQLKQDDILELRVGDAESHEPYSVGVNYEGLVDDFRWRFILLTAA
jgi:pyruvate kinase